MGFSKNDLKELDKKLIEKAKKETGKDIPEFTYDTLAHIQDIQAATSHVSPENAKASVPPEYAEPILETEKNNIGVVTKEENFSPLTLENLDDTAAREQATKPKVTIQTQNTTIPVTPNSKEENKVSSVKDNEMELE